MNQDALTWAAFFMYARLRSAVFSEISSLMLVLAMAFAWMLYGQEGVFGVIAADLVASLAPQLHAPGAKP